MHYFLFGPSGVGKTRFGDWLQDNLQYLNIPVDRGDQDNGLITEGLIELWNKLLEGDPAPFSGELQGRAESKGEKGCVLAFYSVDFLAPYAIGRLAKHDIAGRYLYGPKESCIESYVRRENLPTLLGRRKVGRVEADPLLGAKPGFEIGQRGLDRD